MTSNRSYRIWFSVALATSFAVLMVGLWFGFSPQPRYSLSVPARVEYSNVGAPGVLRRSKWATIDEVSNDGKVTIWIVNGTQQTVGVWDVVAKKPIGTCREFQRDMLQANLVPDWAMFTPGWGRFDRETRTWREFCELLASWRGRELDQQLLARTNSAEFDELLPRGASFSPDGRYFAYRVRNDRPVYEGDARADGTAVIDIETAQRIAWLAGVDQTLYLAPGGKTGVTFTDPDVNEQQKMVFWDLAAQRRRSEAVIPIADLGWRPSVSFSADGRFVFVEVWPSYQLSLIWWDSLSGTECGRIREIFKHSIVESAGVVVVNYWPGDDHRFELWDIASGGKTAELLWGARFPADFQTNELSATPNSSLLAIVRDRAPIHRMPHQGESSRSRVLVVDIATRRELADLPGRSARFSLDGHWLATLDEDGVVRVWQLPLRKPWDRIFAYSSLATLTFLLIATGLRRITFRVGRPISPTGR